jgi:4-amino-4-deoxy-L-arabinose transferase-like glycosyltransferase
MTPEVSLTIPAHNEAPNIAAVVHGARDALASFATEYEIVLVDDASTDGTAEAARAALGEDASHLRVVTHDRQRGYAVTVCDGLRASRGRLLAFMDGDGQFDARDLGRLLTRSAHADLVAGCRARRADPWYRSVVGRVYNAVVRLAFGVRWRDVDCGLKVIRRNAHEAMSPIHATSAVFNPEMFFKAQRLGLRIEQLPVTHLPRRAGRRSGGRLVPVMRALRDVVLLRTWLAFRWRPPRDATLGRPRRALPWVLPGLLTLTVLRLPSLFEPHWYTDEASYVSTGRTLLRGHVLYSQIWSNKPPLHLWTVAGVVGLFGSSELALHLLTLVSGLLAVGAVAWASFRLLGGPRAAIATFIAGFVLGLPVLDAELAIPESLIIAPLSWAGALLVVRLTEARPDRAPRRIPRWPIGLGVLVAVSIAYQQTAVAEAGAFALAIALSPRARWRDLVAFLVTVVAITSAWLGVAVYTAGAGRVAFSLVGFYVDYTRSVLPSSASGAALHFTEVAVAALLIALGAFLRRASRGPGWILVLWVGASLSVPAIAGQPYAHYLAPAAAPIALTLASLPLPLEWLRRRQLVNRAVRLAPQLAGLGIVAAMASVAGLDWMPNAVPKTINATRTLQQYYGGAITAALQISNTAEWNNDFDARVAADEAVAAWLIAKGLAGTSAVVWSSDSWLYSLADLPVLMPTPPIYNDEVLLGQNGEVETYVDDLQPEVIVVAADAQAQFPEIQKLLATSRYQRVYQSDPEVVWVRSDVVPQLP